MKQIRVSRSAFGGSVVGRESKTKEELGRQGGTGHDLAGRAPAQPARGPALKTVKTFKTIKTIKHLNVFNVRSTLHSNI